MENLSEKLYGRFIVLDGPDGAGKSTQLDMLAKYLGGLGVQVCKVRDPGGTVIGEKIREILLDKSHDQMHVACEVMLYMASRVQLMAEVISPALEEGKCVLSDRWVSSTIAYQGAGGTDTRWIESMAEITMGGIWPDLTILLDLPSETGLARVGSEPDRMEAKGLQFHENVRLIFLDQAESHPEVFAVVDAGGDIDDVHKHIRDIIENRDF